MEKKKSDSKKVIILLTSILIAMVVAFTAVTLAWFTDTENFNSGTITFGVVEIDTQSVGSSGLTSTVTRSVGEYLTNGKVMPGDTVNFSLKIQLTANSEPSYYLVKVAGTGVLSSLTVDGYYYLDGTVQTATDSSKSAGVIAGGGSANAVTLNIPFVISTEFTDQGVTGNLSCTVAVIQQANVGYSNEYSSLTTEQKLVARKSAAYDLLKEMLDPTPVVSTSVTLGSSSLSPYVGFSATTLATELGFYYEAPTGYTLDNNKTTALQATVTGDTDTIFVYTKDSTKIAIVSAGTIYADSSLMMPFMFSSNLISLKCENFDTSGITSVQSWFMNCTNLESMDLSSWDLSNCNAFGGMLADVSTSVSITCSQATKDYIMAHNGNGEGDIAITLTNANFIVV